MLYPDKFCNYDAQDLLRFHLRYSNVAEVLLNAARYLQQVILSCLCFYKVKDPENQI